MLAADALDDVLERLLADEETKDVEIEMSDGLLRAHSLILGATSDAIKGMLRHGTASMEKRLSWREHPMEVGRFFMRLLYTGTIAEEEWIQSESDRVLGDEEVPLRLLLGGLSIAKVYLVPHVLRSLTEALKDRLTVQTFNDIFSHSIKLDITALRLHCLQFAQQEHRVSTRGREVRSGARVMALVRITVNSANVPRGGMGTVSTLPAGGLHVNWDNGFVNMIEGVMDMIEIIGEPKTNPVQQMFEANALSPEVMSELAPVWGRPQPTAKRRRKL